MAMIDQRLFFATFPDLTCSTPGGQLSRSRSGRGNVAKTEVYWGVYAGIPMLETLIEVAEATVAVKSCVRHLEDSAKNLLRRYNDPFDDEDKEVIWGLKLHVESRCGPPLVHAIADGAFRTFYYDNTELVLMIATHFARWTSLKAPGLDIQTRLLRFMILNPRLPGSTEECPINIQPDMTTTSTAGVRARLATDEEIVEAFKKETGFKVSGARAVSIVRENLLKGQRYLERLRERMELLGI